MKAIQNGTVFANTPAGYRLKTTWTSPYRELRVIDRTIFIVSTA